MRAQIIDVPRKTPQEILIGLNDRRADLHDVYRLSISTGERTLLRKNDDNVVAWATDENGVLRLGIRMTQSGGSEILKIDGDKLVSIYSVTADESAAPIRFTGDATKFYLVTNKGSKIDKAQLELFDVATGKTKFIERDPKNEVDLASAIFSDVTNEMLATVYIGDRVRIYPKQKAFAASWEALKRAVPPGEIGVSSMTEDEVVWVVSVSSDTDP